MVEKIKLTYFDFYGWGEPIKFILSYVGADFEDVRITMDEWPKIKETIPFKQVPKLEIDGKTLYQTIAICRYLGQKYGLEAQDKWTNYQLEALVDHVRDIHPLFRNYLLLDIQEAKKEFQDKVTTVFGLLDSFAVDGYFYGKKATWVDVFFAGYIETFDAYAPGVIEAYPNLVDLVKRVKSKENLVKYLKNRPELALFKK